MSILPKRVCIIGAGPAGLVAAKTLAYDHKGSFHVTVFEKNCRIGGLWPTSSRDNGLVNPEMSTNQSRHTVAFSDLAWPETAPSFPKAWQVGQYLERYIETYPGYDIELETHVVKTEFDTTKWTVQVVGKDGAATREFDHLIVATGFFGKPVIPEIFDGVDVPVWHSCKIRSVRELLTDGGKTTVNRGKNIIVLGGQMSGIETAASLAFGLSSAANSPGDSSDLDAKDYVVTNVFQKANWVMPLFFPSDPKVDITESKSASKGNNSAPHFLPLDMIFYNLLSRPPGPLSNTSGHVSPEAANFTHNLMKTCIGNDQSWLGVPVLSMTGDVVSKPPYLSCSDQYTEFVRHKKIRVVQGHVISGTGNSVEIQDANEKITITDVAAIVCATGFSATPSLDFLPSDVLKTLQHAPDQDGFPLALNVHTTVSKMIPSLGFTGFYRSPYWGTIEMQARFLGQLWSGNHSALKALEEDTTLEESMIKLRNNSRRSQFPMGDYVYLMENFASILGIQRQEPDDSTGRTGTVFPFRYLSVTADSMQKAEAQKALGIANQVFADSATKGKYLARAIFRALQGLWYLERNIDSRIISFPSGKLLGTASFLPRYPTDEDADMEHLYYEKGDFKPSWGGTMNAKRSYVYHYNEAKDKMNVWFVQPDFKTSDYFFHELEFLIPTKAKGGGEPWRARSSHLCIDDMYDVKYEFYFKGTTLDKWTSEYTVTGPNKDYTISNVYTRPT